MLFGKVVGQNRRSPELHFLPGNASEPSGLCDYTWLGNWFSATTLRLDQEYFCAASR